MKILKSNKKKKVLSIIGILMFWISWVSLTNALAEKETSTKVSSEIKKLNPALENNPSQIPPADLFAPSGRKSSLDFEDQIIEGMNQNPFDSLTTIDKRDNKNSTKLYRKKSDFRYEIKLTLREMSFFQ